MTFKMASTRNLSKMGLWFFFTVFFNLGLFVLSEKVPVYIMGLKSSANYPSASAFGSLSHKEFRAKYLDTIANDHKSIVAFVQDRLSAEDLGKNSRLTAEKDKSFPHLESHLRKSPSMVLPNVDNPIEGLRSMKSSMKVREINANSQEKLKADLLKPEVLIFHLPSTLNAENKKEALRNNDKIIHDVIEDLQSSNKDLVAIYTGLKPSYDSDSEMELHYRVARQLKSVDETNFINETQKFYMYGNNITVTVQSISHNLSESAVLTFSKENIKYDIDANNTDALVTFTYNSAVVLNNLVLTIKLTNNTPSKFWQNGDIEISGTFPKSPALDSKMPLKLQPPYVMGASKGFSYSCGNLQLKGSYKNASEKIDVTVTFAIQRFQAEWFPPNDYFSESFDCFTFFTIPIWMGLFVVILFTAILAFGIFMLFEVKTMDRFDDPKGKCITVPLGE